MLGLGISLSATRGRAQSPFSDHALALDFRNGLYRQDSKFVAGDDKLSQLDGYSFSRTGAKQELAAESGLVPFAAGVPGIVPGVGYWSRTSVTNMLLDAGQASNPPTQSVSVSAQAYTLSFFGTGSVTLSGAHAASLAGSGADARAALSFTPSAGTLTLTVAGNVHYAGLVAGAGAGPVIATGAAATTLGADALRLSPAVLADEDFLLFVRARQMNAVGFKNLLAFTGSGWAGQSIMLYANGASLGASVSSNGTGQSVGTFSLTASAGQDVALSLRRRAGRFTVAGKAGATTSVGSEGAAASLPTIIDRFEIGLALASGQANLPISFVGYRKGTFSDAEMIAALAA